DLTEAFAALDGCGADAELIALADRCLEAEPADRPRNAGEVAQAVAAHLAAGEERAREAEVQRAGAGGRGGGAKGKGRGGGRARQLTVGLAAAVLLFVVAGGGGWLWVAQDRAAREREELAHLADAEQSANLPLGRAEQLTDQARKADAKTAAEEGRVVVLWQQ